MEEKKKLVTIRSGSAGDRKHLANLIRKMLVEQILDKEVEQKKSAEQSTLAKELDQALGQEEFKALGQDIALVIAEHKLTKNQRSAIRCFVICLLWSLAGTRR